MKDFKQISAQNRLNVSTDRYGLTWQCWWVWVQSCPVRPLTPVSPGPLNWCLWSPEAELQRWHTGRTWPFWKVQNRTSAGSKDRKQGYKHIFYPFLWILRRNIYLNWTSKTEPGKFTPTETSLTETDEWFMTWTPRSGEQQEKKTSNYWEIKQIH